MYQVFFFFLNAFYFTDARLTITSLRNDSKRVVSWDEGPSNIGFSWIDTLSLDSDYYLVDLYARAKEIVEVDGIDRFLTKYIHYQDIVHVYQNMESIFRYSAQSQFFNPDTMEDGTGNAEFEYITYSHPEDPDLYFTSVEPQTDNSNGPSGSGRTDANPIMLSMSDVDYPKGITLRLNPGSLSRSNIEWNYNGQKVDSASTEEIVIVADKALDPKDLSLDKAGMHMLTYVYWVADVNSGISRPHSVNFWIRVEE
jgi:hypothetical protein